MKRCCFFLLFLIPFGVLNAQEPAIQWESARIQHGWVYSHPRYPGFLADTVVVRGENFSDEMVVFNFDFNAMKATHYYFNGPKSVKVDQRFQVTVGIPARDQALGRIEMYSKYLNFPTTRKTTSGFLLEYFLVDSNVNHVYDRGILRELRGVDFSGLPVRLILDDDQRPVIYENYDPRSNSSIGVIKEWEPTMGIWKDIKTASLVRFEAMIVYPDSLRTTESYNRRAYSSFVERPVDHIDEVWIFERGISFRVDPMKVKFPGHFVLSVPEDADSVVFKYKGLKQVVHLLPNQPNASFMSGVRFYDTKTPLMASGPTLTYFKWDSLRGHVGLDYAYFSKDGVLDSLKLEAFEKRYAEELIFNSDFTCTYNFVSSAAAAAFVNDLKKEPGVSVIAPVLSALGSPYETHFYGRVQVQLKSGLTEDEVLALIKPLGFDRIIRFDNNGNHIIGYGSKLLDEAFVKSLNALWRAKGVYAVTPQFYYTLDVDFND